MPQTYQNDGLADVRELYKTVMADIEPELLLENIPHMQKKYANETASEKQARKQRYVDALNLCFECMDKVMDTMKDNMNVFKMEVVKLSKNAEEIQRTDALQSIENSLNTDA